MQKEATAPVIDLETGKALPVAKKSASGSSEINVKGFLGPLAQNFTFGTLSGVCTGYAFKRLGREAAYILGLGFISLQVLAYNGYVTVNWNKVEGDFNNSLDINKDGKVDSEDLQLWANKMYNVVKYHGPTGAGFGTGVYLGLRYG